MNYIITNKDLALIGMSKHEWIPANGVYSDIDSVKLLDSIKGMAERMGNTTVIENLSDLSVKYDKNNSHTLFIKIINSDEMVFMYHLIRA